MPQFALPFSLSRQIEKNRVDFKQKKKKKKKIVFFHVQVCVHNAGARCFMLINIFFLAKLYVEVTLHVLVNFCG